MLYVALAFYFGVLVLLGVVDGLDANGLGRRPGGRGEEERRGVEGRVETAHFGDYKIPTIRDIPELRTVLVGRLRRGRTSRDTSVVTICKPESATVFFTRLRRPTSSETIPG